MIQPYVIHYFVEFKALKKVLIKGMYVLVMRWLVAAR